MNPGPSSWRNSACFLDASLFIISKFISVSFSLFKSIWISTWIFISSSKIILSKKECGTSFSYENVFFCCNIFVIHALVWRLSFVASVATYTSAHEEFEWALCRKPYEYVFALFLGSRRSWLGYKGCCTGRFWGSCFLSFSFLSSLFWRLDFFGGWPPWLPGPPWPPAPPLTAFIFFGMSNSENGRGDFIIIIRTGGSSLLLPLPPWPHFS